MLLPLRDPRALTVVLRLREEQPLAVTEARRERVAPGVWLAPEPVGCAEPVKLEQPDEEVEPEAEALLEGLCESTADTDAERESSALNEALAAGLGEGRALPVAIREAAIDFVAGKSLKKLPQLVAVAARVVNGTSVPPAEALPDAEHDPDGEPLGHGEGSAEAKGEGEAVPSRVLEALLRALREGCALAAPVAVGLRVVVGGARRLLLGDSDCEGLPEAEALPETETLPEAEPLPDTESEAAAVSEAEGCGAAVSEALLGLLSEGREVAEPVRDATLLPLLLAVPRLRVGLVEPDTQLLAVGDCEAQPEGEGEPEAEAEPLGEPLLRAESELDMEAAGEPETEGEVVVLPRKLTDWEVLIETVLDAVVLFERAALAEVVLDAVVLSEAALLSVLLGVAVSVAVSVFALAVAFEEPSFDWVALLVDEAVAEEEAVSEPAPLADADALALGEAEEEAALEADALAVALPVALAVSVLALAETLAVTLALALACALIESDQYTVAALLAEAEDEAETETEAVPVAETVAMPVAVAEADKDLSVRVAEAVALRVKALRVEEAVRVLAPVCVELAEPVRLDVAVTLSCVREAVEVPVSEKAVRVTVAVAERALEPEDVAVAEDVRVLPLVPVAVEDAVAVMRDTVPVAVALAMAVRDWMPLALLQGEASGEAVTALEIEAVRLLDNVALLQPERVEDCAAEGERRALPEPAGLPVLSLPGDAEVQSVDVGLWVPLAVIDTEPEGVLVAVSDKNVLVAEAVPVAELVLKGERDAEVQPLLEPVGVSESRVLVVVRELEAHPDARAEVVVDGEALRGGESVPIAEGLRVTDGELEGEAKALTV